MRTGHPRRPRRFSTAGLTLIELMVAMAILALGVLGTIGAYQFITTSIQHSKNRTLANNLAQEKIEKLKNLSYYSLLVTTDTITNSHISTIYYDNVNYTPESLTEGGVAFTRATRIDLATQNGSTISLVPFSSDDTGLKQITVYVVWQEGTTWQYKEMHNLLSNPSTNPLSGTLKGTVTKNPGNTAITNAYVQVLENPSYFSFTNSSGNYSFNVSPGSYTLQATATGYFLQTSTGYISIDSGQTSTNNFSLGVMSTGTVSGTAYLDNHLVISEVVPSTGPANDIEYIELYNPTTAAINVNTSGTIFTLWDYNSNSVSRHLYYTNSSVPSQGYFLISNTGVGTPGNVTSCSTFTIAGTAITPDACWLYALTPKHALECTSSPCPTPGTSSSPNAGGVVLYDLSGNVVDKVGWAKNNGGGNDAPANAVEGTQIVPTSTNGLQPNEALVRYSSSGTISATYGRAFDSNNNSVDFGDTTPLAHTSSTSQVPVSGTPAAGAMLYLNDGLSAAVQADSSGNFSIPGAATGTWTLIVSTSTYYSEINTISVTANTTTSVPNSGTSPVWPASGYNNALLNATTNYAFVSGTVRDATGNALSGIAVSGQGLSVNTGSTGRYFLGLSSGTNEVIANPNNVNHSYTSASTTTFMDAGVVYDPTDFTLQLGGSLRVYFQTSVNTALPNRIVVAASNGGQQSQATSDKTGYAFLNNLSTGTYTLTPALDPAENASPTSQTAVLNSTGTSTSISTFTVSNALATLTGHVYKGASGPTSLITTGVLIVASTSTIPSTPLKQNGSTGPDCAPCYYAGSSDATGNYSLDVRSSTTTTYNIYGWYTTFSGSTPTTTRSSLWNVSVSSGGATYSHDFLW